MNDATKNNAALHAVGDCAVSDAVAQTGSWKSTNCSVAHDGNQGCGTNFSEPFSYGASFNSNGGGVSYCPRDSYQHELSLTKN